MSTDTSGAETFSITPEQAELYESQFVPGVFAEWAPRVVAYAGVAPGDHVLDVACGTGIVARVAADAAGPDGAVTGVDLNPAMLGVARRLRPELTWRHGAAEALPLSDHSVDVTTCQMAMMFFADRAAAWREMARVTRRRVAVVVPASIDDQPAYSLLTEVVRRHAGDAGAALLMTYWSAGDLERLTAEAVAGGLSEVQTTTVLGTAVFDSVDAFVATEVEGSPLVDRIDAPTYARIRSDAAEALAAYVDEVGAVRAPLRCHLLRAAP